MSKKMGIISACAHRLYLYRPELFGTLWDAGYEVVVFGPESQAEGDKWLGELGIKYVELPLERRQTDPLAELKAQALITQTVSQDAIGLLFSYGIRFAPLANNSAKRAGIPCINVINGLGNLFIERGKSGAAKRAAILPYLKASLSYSSRIIFQNYDDRDLFYSLKLGSPHQYLNVCGSGVNTARYPVCPLPHKKVFGFLSRLNPEKGIHELLSAFENVLTQYPDVRLILAGELDGIRSETEDLLGKLIESGSADYLGEIDDVRPFFNEVRYFVFPSYREGTPRVNLEAMSCGRPIITTDAPGCRETVRDGVNGLLVKVRDVETLEKAMLRFCDDDDMTARMAEQSRKIAEEKFDVHSVNRILLGEIQKVL
ncbi:MAG: glycosyltransferase family 4 protein [Clostridia bacterium]|nr:glycosyltransferase family 4 protein [Clostridia bacterium]